MKLYFDFQNALLAIGGSFNLIGKRRATLKTTASQNR